MTNFRCAAPWRGLHINPRGDVKTCCAGDPNMLGNLNNNTIEQILTSPIMQEIRQSLRRGEPHQYCSNCVQAERYGSSERNWHNTVNQEFDSALAGDLEHIPTLIDVRWNTTCNLSCNYCGDKCSSKWAALRQIPFRSGARPYYEQVCSYLDQHREHIREVALVGGEPLLLPENKRLLDVISNNCTVTLITNLSVDLERNEIFEKLSRRNNVGWSMSFENTCSRFEYVRSGAVWHDLDANLDKVKQLMINKNHWGGIHAVYNIYNCTRLRELKLYAQSKDVTILWQTLFQPQYLDPAYHSRSLKDIALQEIQMYEQDFGFTQQEKIFFANVKTRLMNASPLDLGQELSKHIWEIENAYHTHDLGRFQQLWPEISAILPLQS